MHIDVVGLALPHSVGLGKVFLKNGVKHVLCFDDANSNYTAGQYSEETQKDLVRFQFNFIYCFCVQFYSNLANQMSVIDAFDTANRQISDDQLQEEEVWQLNDLPFTMECLNIKAVLLDPESPVHLNRLFDGKATGGD